jgi:hypothetical protein
LRARRDSNSQPSGVSNQSGLVYMRPLKYCSPTVFVLRNQIALVRV